MRSNCVVGKRRGQPRLLLLAFSNVVKRREEKRREEKRRGMLPYAPITSAARAALVHGNGENSFYSVFFEMAMGTLPAQVLARQKHAT
jgi:hypothetical protein